MNAPGKDKLSQRRHCCYHQGNVEIVGGQFVSEHIKRRWWVSEHLIQMSIDSKPSDCEVWSLERARYSSGWTLLERKQSVCDNWITWEGPKVLIGLTSMCVWHTGTHNRLTHTHTHTLLTRYIINGLISLIAHHFSFIQWASLGCWLLAFGESTSQFCQLCPTTTDNREPTRDKHKHNWWTLCVCVCVFRSTPHNIRNISQTLYTIFTGAQFSEP